MSNGYYFSGVACLNGHELNGYVGLVGRDYTPKPIDKFCPQCGVAAVTKCEHCQTDIRGTVRGGMSAKDWKVVGEVLMKVLSAVAAEGVKKLLGM
jgi:hypothetical protein